LNKSVFKIIYAFKLNAEYKIKISKFNIKMLHLMFKTKIFYLNSLYLLLFSKVGIVIAIYILNRLSSFE